MSMTNRDEQFRQFLQDLTVKDHELVDDIERAQHVVIERRAEFEQCTPSTSEGPSKRLRGAMNALAVAEAQLAEHRRRHAKHLPSPAELDAQRPKYRADLRVRLEVLAHDVAKAQTRRGELEAAAGVGNDHERLTREQREALREAELAIDQAERMLDAFRKANAKLLAPEVTGPAAYQSKTDVDEAGAA